MPRSPMQDSSLLEAALEGLELQRRRVEEQIRQVQQILRTDRGASVRKASKKAARAPAAGKRALSEEARKRISLAQRKRWASYRRTPKT